MMRRYSLIVGILSIGLFAGCDATAPDEYEPEVVVEAYLESGALLPDIRLSRTGPIDAEYDPEEHQIEGAAVRLRLLDAEGDIEYEYPYRQGRAGLYYPIQNWPDASRVEPLRTYELHAEVPGQAQPITARTFVPDTFHVANISSNAVEYLSDRQLTFELSPTTYPGRQIAFLITTVALDGRDDQLTPFAAGLLEDSELTIHDLRERTAPILNEANFQYLENDYLRVRFPWIGIYFYGRNEIVVNTIDDNLHDFVRSQSIQQGGSTLPPGEIPNVIEHVEGARGIFGSYARASLSVVVLRPEDR